MRRNKNHVRPHLEGLEAMTLLSGMAAVGVEHHPRVAPFAQVRSFANSPVALNGRLTGQFVVHVGAPDTGARYRFFALGNLNGQGETISVGSFTTPGGTVRLFNFHGSLTLNIQQVGPTTPPTAGQPTTLQFQYTVTSGTGQYQGDTGTGALTVRLSTDNTPGPNQSAFGRLALRFTSGVATTV